MVNYETVAELRFVAFAVARIDLSVGAGNLCVRLH
jgi:hypothetical protein